MYEDVVNFTSTPHVRFAQPLYSRNYKQKVNTKTSTYDCNYMYEQKLTISRVCLKLLGTPLNVLLYGHFKNIFLCICTYYLGWTLPVQLRGTRNKWTLQKILSTVGFEPNKRHSLQITSRPSLPIGQFSNITSEGIKLALSPTGILST